MEIACHLLEGYLSKMNTCFGSRYTTEIYVALNYLFYWHKMILFRVKHRDVKCKVKILPPGTDILVTSQVYHVCCLRNFWMQYIEILFRLHYIQIS